MITFVELMKQVMDAPKLRTREAIWHLYLTEITDGKALEFGVYKGGSINYMAAVCPEAAFHGFDGFIGLAESWRNLPAGYFSTDLSKLKFRENVILHVGEFEKTLPEYVNLPSGRLLQAIHIDCDLGSSTATALRHLTQQIIETKPLILFDEFYNYAGYEQHEAGAFSEWSTQNAVKFEIVARTTHEQVLIRIL
ncbi:class I SAM-dependent methyltransferase [Prosthecobacter sp.]|uniref:class I SAM-dependent methyltransferase n=1 Tax=Prosthecobacter sp. TaxID=1965333 RepID=UPI002487B450|nr:class I SAM-dependent methyltransferase [Prosthecobacter sp.]MDI1314807.1 hypothetical protein [Prosthecobacter sp.]